MTEVVFQPVGKHVEIDPKHTILEAAQAAGVAISAVCGGIGACSSCRARVMSGEVSAPNTLEYDMLSDEELESGLRLTCQTTITGTERILVDVPAESLSAPQRSQVEGAEIAVDVEPSVAWETLTAVIPGPDDLRGDWDRLTGIDPLSWHPTAPVLAGLPPRLRRHDWQVRMVHRDRAIVSFLAPDAVPVGFAVDIGTTGLAAYLIDLTDGQTIGIAGTTNPQIAYGEDVMARLTLTVRDPDGGRRLQKTIIDGLNDLLEDVCRQASIMPEQVVDVVAVGNTAMHHLLLGLPVEQLGSAPYVPTISAAISTPAAPLGLHVAPGASLYLPPNVAGFVGADHVAMLLATETAQQPGVTLSLDIGTNTEITLNAHGQMWSCSTASGPAFEGAHIRDGMRAARGAIERLAWDNNHLRWLTIDHALPVGLCGSGILDAVALLRERDILNATGRIQGDHPAVRREGRRAHVEIVAAAESGHGRPITLSRADVNEIQLAKAAIRAGSQLLLEQANLAEQAIDRVIVAGAFGNYIDLPNAITIGMFPPLPLNRFIQVGNAAGIGAKRLLINRTQRQQAQSLVRQLHYIELTNHPHFTDRFSQAVRLDPIPWD